MKLTAPSDSLEIDRLDLIEPAQDTHKLGVKARQLADRFDARFGDTFDRDQAVESLRNFASDTAGLKADILLYLVSTSPEAADAAEDAVARIVRKHS